MSVRGGPQITTRALQSCYDVQSPKSYVSGSSTWIDLVGTSNGSFTTNGPTYDGYGLIFNSGAATGQAFQVYTTVSTGMFSMEIWVNRFPSAWNQMIVNTSLYFTGGQSYEVPYSNSTMEFRLTSWQMNSTSLFATFTTGSYNQFYLSHNSGVAKLYKNGVLASSGSLTSGAIGTRPIAQAATIMQLCNPIGPPPSPNSQSSFGSAGEIGIIRIYTDELSAVEVAQNWNADRGRYGL